jgi:ectoine hydroxylase-related dioxygenase (phytanoyl-CoA dioxygenase family)
MGTPDRIETQGFDVIEQVFDANEIDALSGVLSGAALARSRAGARHLMSDPAVAEFARAERLLCWVRSVLGPEALPFRATLFDKSPTSNWLVVWHQDTALPLRERREAPGWGPWSVKAGVIYARAPAAALNRVLALRIHLDDSTESNGPLRVIPGTHRSGVLRDEEVSLFAQERKACDCLVSRGGVLAMRPLLIHASSKSRIEAPRRVIHIEYAASMTLEHGLELAIA